MATETKLVPPDRERCQAEKPNPDWSPFILGPGSRPQDRVVRCESRPVAVVTEAEPGDDGRAGSMSLCAGCLLVFARQMPDKKVEVEQLG